MGIESDQAQMMAVVDSRLAGDWVTEGFLTSPGANTVDADTGPLVAGFYDVTFFVWNGSNAIEGYNLEWRNAANTANLALQIISVGIQQYLTTFLLRNFKVAASQRFRVLNRTDVVGVTQSSIIYTQRS